MKKNTPAPAENKYGGEILFFLLLGSLLSVLFSSLFAAAGFLYYVPYLNWVSAVFLTPLFCMAIQKFFLRKTEADTIVIRILTGFVSLLASYSYVCVFMGTVSGVIGAYPLSIEEIREIEFTVYIERLNTVFGNAANYFVTPWMLWQDLFGRGEAMWALCCAAGVFAQIGLPQIFIHKKTKGVE